jgi:hypothetical protein
MGHTAIFASPPDTAGWSDEFLIYGSPATLRVNPLLLAGFIEIRSMVFCRCVVR